MSGGHSVDTLSRAVETMLSHGSDAFLVCSECGGKALSIASNGGLGVPKGVWSRMKNVDNWMMRLQTVGMETCTTLIVQSNHVVISAEHLYEVGLGHANHGEGFSRGITTLSEHKCRKCATVGESLRISAAGRLGLEESGELIHTRIERRILDGDSARLLCSSKSCSGVVWKGLLIPPLASSAQATASAALVSSSVPALASSSVPALASSSVPALASSSVPALASCGSPPLATMLYFSRGRKNQCEEGIVVWVVMHMLPVVVVSDYATVFDSMFSGNLRSLNILCGEHATTFPRNCVVCCGEISKADDAVMLLGDEKYAAHKDRCAQFCKRWGCNECIVKIAPTPEEAVEVERNVALEALCPSLDGVTCIVSQFKKKTVKQAPIADGYGIFVFTGKAQIEGKKLEGKKLEGKKLEGKKLEGGQKARAFGWWGGNESDVEGIAEGGHEVVRRSDNTVACKCNIKGKIEYHPIDGELFRELDGSITTYEYGQRQVIKTL
jgi:hypothetical protein